MNEQPLNQRPWGSEHDRPRVLIEHADQAEAWADARVLSRAANLEVVARPVTPRRLVEGARRALRRRPPHFRAR